MKLPEYEHVFCECGGHIGMRDGQFFRCDKCNKMFQLHALTYDLLMINDRTGWIFPVRNRRDDSD